MGNLNGTLDGGKISSFAGGLEYAVKKLGSIKILTLFRVTLFLMVLVGVAFSANVAMNQSAVEKIVEAVISHEKEEKMSMDIRDMVSPKIQKRLSSIVYSIDCDRAFVIELHNGKKNATELPFKYFDMTYEEVNENRHIKNVSQHFNNIMVTHYKLPYYLVEKTYFFGTVEELEKIDRRYAANFEEYGGKYLAIMILRSNGDEIGFLGIAYNDLGKVADENKIKKTLDDEGKIMKDLLDLGVQKITLTIDKKNA